MSEGSAEQVVAHVRALIERGALRPGDRLPASPDGIMNAALVISDRDNVATALEPLEPGATLRMADAAVTIVDRIPRGHKVAIRSIPAGEAVLKYGSPIGRAVVAIPPGTHVHTHNVASGRGRGDLVARSAGAGSDPGGPRIAEPPDLDSAPADADS